MCTFCRIGFNEKGLYDKEHGCCHGYDNEVLENYRKRNRISKLR